MFSLTGIKCPLFIHAKPRDSLGVFDCSSVDDPRSFPQKDVTRKRPLSEIGFFILAIDHGVVMCRVGIGLFD